MHIGAHKSASTHFQALCMANRAALRACGCAYFGPERLRDDLKLPGYYPSRDAMRGQGAALRQVLGAESRAGRCVLLSDENILGSPRPPATMSGAQLYPKAAARLEAAFAALDLSGVRLALCIRNPLDWLVSGWGHQFLAGRPVGFEDFCSGIAPMALRWSEMAGRLLGLEAVSGVVLWRYEDYRALAPQLPTALVGLEPLPVQAMPEEGRARRYLTGPSARAITALPRIMAREPDLTAHAAMRKAMSRFPKGANWPGPQPFAAAQRAEAQQSYLEDWARLAELESVTCLTP
ncbi:sulfotransferase domain-containing protein [Natronohydrobacter thiooxidans]|uniref:sulfotransferase domain-containing protein n=1 Tax=Natronohydrobacter thiooxidans TaxID=87172 RepID=UPI001114AB0A|nr:sulfotransferase domain-containing protein [Natronohydrobacter thiooxidans]